MTAARQILGERGERIAEQYLVERGWTVVDRRFRSGHRDIDLVMKRNGSDGGVIAFVEVKTRVSAGYGGPLGAVHWRKQREMIRAARAWMSGNRATVGSYRFDVVGVRYGSGPPQIVHVENAFQLR